MSADKKTMRLPDDVLKAIRRVRIAGGYPSDTAALCAIVRIATPAILSRFDNFSLPDSVLTMTGHCTDNVQTAKSDIVPTLSGQRTDNVPTRMSDTVPTTTGHCTDEDDPTLAAMAAIDFDAEI